MESSKSENKFIVLGEASESEDDDNVTKPAFRRDNIVAQCIKPIVAGEASESDDSDDYYNVAEAFADKRKTNPPKPPKYNSLLHKKLRENNWSLRESLKNFVHERFEFASGEINNVNQHLLTAQVQLQEAATSLRKSSMNTSKLTYLLSTIDHNKVMSNLKTEAFIDLA